MSAPAESSGVGPTSPNEPSPCSASISAPLPDGVPAAAGLGRAGAFNPGARLVAPKQGTGKRLSPKEREKLRKEREKEERRKRREQRNQGRDDDGASPVRPR